jgi:hypothetical protein
MAQSKPMSIARINDVVLGGLGASIPPNKTMDKAAKFFGTWGGSDKLMGVLQYSAKLLALYLEWRAKASKGRSSSAAASLRKLATLIGDSRVLWGIWGLLPILQWLSALERSNPPSRKLLTLERCQALSMTAFYPLEHFSFLARQGVLPSSLALTFAGRKLGSVPIEKFGLWSCRCWMAYVLLQLVHLKEDWEILGRSEKRGKGVAGQLGGEEAKKEVDRRRKALFNELIVNLGYLPLTIHWSLPNGLFTNELWTSMFGFIAAAASFRGGWMSMATSE